MPITLGRYNYIYFLQSVRDIYLAYHLKRTIYILSFLIFVLLEMRLLS